MKKIFYVTLFLLINLVISGCASTPSENLKRTFTRTYAAPSIVDYPTVGEVRTIEVGESLVYKDKQTSIPSIDIESPFDQASENLGTKFKITILPGRFKQIGKDPYGKFFEASEDKFLVDEKKLPSSSCGIYIDDSDALKNELFCLSKEENKPLSYPSNKIIFTKSIFHKRDDLSFKKELVYTGISQNVVSILYREFTNDMARPAFSQDLKYDLSESKTVGYRGSRFEIIKATNQGLTYKTLKQLD